jgi:hypothetical protein
MNDVQKQSPEPLDQSDVLKSALNRAAKGEFDDDLSISLRISGGAPQQRYRFTFEATGARLEACELDCEVSDRRASSEGHEVEPKTLSALGRSLARSGFLDAAAQSPRFLPDTLVGILEVTSGDTTRRVYFAADPDQAAVQDTAPPDAVLKAADAVFQAAGSILRVDNVRP